MSNLVLFFYKFKQGSYRTIIHWVNSELIGRIIIIEMNNIAYPVFYHSMINLGGFLTSVPYYPVNIVFVSSSNAFVAVLVITTFVAKPLAAL